MFSALIILLPLSFINTLNIRSNRYKPIFNKLFWIFVSNFLFLIWLGSKSISNPYIMLGQISTIIYFKYFIIIKIIG